MQIESFAILFSNNSSSLDINRIVIDLRLYKRLENKAKHFISNWPSQEERATKLMNDKLFFPFNEQTQGQNFFLATPTSAHLSGTKLSTRQKVMSRERTKEKVYLTKIIIIKTNEISHSCVHVQAEFERKTIREISSSTFTVERYFIACTSHKKAFGFFIILMLEVDPRCRALTLIAVSDFTQWGK